MTLSSITTQSRVISAIESQFNFTDSNITNVYSSTTSDVFLSVSFGSSAILDNIMFSTSTVELVTVLSSTLQITQLDAINITSNDYLISLIDCSMVMLHHINVMHFTSTKDSMMLLSGSSIDSINDFTLFDSNVTGIHIMQSSVNMMTHINISDSSQSIHIQQSHMNLLDNSQFSFSGSTEIINGGAMHIENSNLTMQSTTFDTNTAQTGGAVSINCDSYDS